MANSARMNAGAGHARMALIHDTAYLRKLVYVHPETGRKVRQGPLQARFAVQGLSRDEGARLLDELCDLACQPPRTYRHKWTFGDVVVWAERSVFHRSRPWKHQNVPRLLYGLRTSGDPRGHVALGESDEVLNKEIAWLLETKPWADPNRKTCARGGWTENTKLG